MVGKYFKPLYIRTVVFHLKGFATPKNGRASITFDSQFQVDKCWAFHKITTFGLGLLYARCVAICFCNIFHLKQNPSNNLLFLQGHVHNNTFRVVNCQQIHRAFLKFMIFTCVRKCPLCTCSLHVCNGHSRIHAKIMDSTNCLNSLTVGNPELITVCSRKKHHMLHFCLSS